MGDEDNSCQTLAVDGVEQLHDAGCVGGVEVAGGFISEEQARLVDEGAGYGGALEFPAADFVREPAGFSGETRQS